MAPPIYNPHDPYVGALHELAAAAASLSGARIQPEHARDHVVCAAELVKRAHRSALGPVPPPVMRRADWNAAKNGVTDITAWIANTDADPANTEWIEVVW